MGKVITYGVGGYDPTKPNNNIVEEYETPDIDVPDDRQAAMDVVIAAKDSDIPEVAALAQAVETLLAN